MRLEQQLVKARSRRIAIEPIGDELVVYDLDTDAAHLLNPVVASVWQACDGRSVAALLPVVEGADDDAKAAVVWEALAELQRARLLSLPIHLPGESRGMTRRQLLKRAGIAAVALPVITSIVAPTPAAAATCGQACTLNTQCTDPTGTTGCRCPVGGGTCVACTAQGVKPGGANCNTTNQYLCCSGACATGGSSNFCS